MVVEAAPAATFIVPEAKLLLEFLVVPLDEPTRLGRMDQSLQTCLRRQGARIASSEILLNGVVAS